MSLPEEKRNKVKKYILETIFGNRGSIVEKTSVNFNISKQTVYKYIRELINEGSVQKISNGNYRLAQTVNERFVYQMTDRKLEEDVIFDETLSKYIRHFNTNTYKIWQYSFTEMVNNVIDHSGADKMKIYIGQNALCTWVNILDNGIGIFKKITDYYKYETLGTYSKKIDSYKNTEGTLIVMALTNDTNRSLKEVFDMYSSVEGGFTITKIPMKMICDSGYPVSRSQAKRLYFGFDRFEKVILDFSGVDEIGQAFAHELFQVFQKKHPEIEIQCINTNEDINKMINRVTQE